VQVIYHDSLSRTTILVACFGGSRTSELTGILGDSGIKRS